MKRFSLLAVVVAASMVGVLAIAASSASAAVLCKKTSASHYCGAENTYLKGTTVHAQLAPGTTFHVEKQSGQTWTDCSSSELDVTTNRTGGPEEAVDANINKFTLGGCGAATSVVEWNWAYFTWTPEAAGALGISAITELSTSPFGFDVPCRYIFFGPGKVVNGKQVVFNKAESFEGGSNGFLCPIKPVFSATYNITTPSPLYVERY